MKKTLTTIFGVLLSMSQLNAQFNFFEPIKSPIKYPKTVMEQVYIGYPNIVTQDANGTSWVNREKTSFPFNTQGDILKFANYSWNTTSNAWDTPEMEVNFTYTYDGANKMTGYTRVLFQQGTKAMERTTSSMVYNNNKILTVSYTDNVQGQQLPGKDSYTYNSNGLLTEKVSAYVMQGMEVPLNRIVYTYSGNNITEELIQNQSGGGWKDDMKSTFTYDSQNRMITMMKENYDEDNSKWEKEEDNIYTYNSNNQLASHEKHDSWDGTSYQGHEKQIYTYDGSQKLISLETQAQSNGNWVNEEKASLTYKGNEPFEAYVYPWTGSAYSTTASEKVIWSDPNPSTGSPAAPSNLVLEPLRGDKIMRLTWKDNATNETGFIVERSSDGISFSQVADIKTANTQSYDDTGLPDATTYYYRVLAYNASGSSVASNVAQAKTLTASISDIALSNTSIYPNPASSNLTVNVKETTNYKIVSLTGQVIKEGAIEPNNNSINVSDLKSGNYFIQLSLKDAKTMKLFSVN